MVKQEKVKQEKQEKKPVKKIVKKKEKSKDLTPRGFKASKLEVEKVRWPNKKEMIKYSIATICFVMFFGLFFTSIELIMAFIKNLV